MSLQKLVSHGTVCCIEWDRNLVLRVRSIFHKSILFEKKLSSQREQRAERRDPGSRARAAV